MKIPIDESGGQDVGASYIFGSSSSKAQQIIGQAPPPQAPNRVQEDPILFNVERGAKLEVGDFHGDNNPEVFLDLLHSLESLFW